MATTACRRPATTWPAPSASPARRRPFRRFFPGALPGCAGGGLFLGEILPVEVRAGRKGETRLVERDEHPRPQADLALARLPALFAGGVDRRQCLGDQRRGGGSAAGRPRDRRARGHPAAGADSRQRQRRRRAPADGHRPAAGDPPRAATRRHRPGRGRPDRDQRSLRAASSGLPEVARPDYEDPRVNPHGGAIALGHPLGASGARLVLTAARGLQRIERRYAVVSLCVGLGQGVAMVIERCR